MIQSQYMLKLHSISYNSDLTIKIYVESSPNLVLFLGFNP